MSATGSGVGIHLSHGSATLAVRAGSTTQVVPNAGGALSTPAVVAVDARGRVRVGEAAARRRHDPDRRAIGAVVARLSMGAEGAHEFPDGTLMDPGQLVAELLKSLRLDYAASTGSDLVEATVAIPESLLQEHAQAVSRAAKLAGLERVDLVSESVAVSAAVDWDGMSAVEGTSPSPWLVLVTDDAGFSADVVSDEGGAPTSLGHVELPAATARPLNRRLVDRLVASAGAGGPLDGIDLDDEAFASLLGNLLRLVDAAKRDVWRLGTAQEVFLEARLPVATAEPVDVEFEVELTPTLLAEVESGLLGPLTDACRDLLSESGAELRSLRAVLVTGTCADDPYLLAALGEALGVEPWVDPAPATLIARGAAALAADLRAGEPAGTEETTAERPAAPPPPASTGDDADETPSPADDDIDPTPLPRGEPGDRITAAAPAVLDADRLRELRSDARAQRRRLLDLYRRATEGGDEELVVALHGVVQQRLYERMDGLLHEAISGSAVGEDSITLAVRELAARLDQVEAVD